MLLNTRLVIEEARPELREDETSGIFFITLPLCIALTTLVHNKTYGPVALLYTVL